MHATVQKQQNLFAIVKNNNYYAIKIITVCIIFQYNILLIV